MVDIILDASHGGDDIGSVGSLGLKEKDCTLYIAKACRSILDKLGLSSKLTREDDISIEAANRSEIANSYGERCFLTIHVNSSDDKRECGVEVLCKNGDDESNALAYDIITSLSKNKKINSRGIKTSDLILFNEIKIPSIMIKVCFITNEREEKLLSDKEFNNEIAVLIADGIKVYLDDNPIIKEQFFPVIETVEEQERESEEIETLTNILGGDIPDKNKAKQWAQNNELDDEFMVLADLYWLLYEKRGNVNPAIAFAQAALELSNNNWEELKEKHNPAAIKEEKSEKFKKFDTINDGVLAHLDHLALYAGAANYPDSKSKDPRHFSYLFGVCKSVENLSGKWNADQDYGIRMLKLYYEILGTEIKDVFRESIEGLEGFKSQIGEFKGKVVLMGKTLENVCKEYNEIYKSLEVLKNEIVILEKDKESLETKNKVLSSNLIEQKKVLKDIVKIIGGTIEKK